MILRADESQVNQRHGGNGNTTTILVSLKGLESLHQEKKRTSEHHSDGAFQKYYIPKVRTC